VLKNYLKYFYVFIYTYQSLHYSEVNLSYFYLWISLQILRQIHTHTPTHTQTHTHTYIQNFKHVGKNFTVIIILNYPSNLKDKMIRKHYTQKNRLSLIITHSSIFKKMCPAIWFTLFGLHPPILTKVFIVSLILWGQYDIS
jgi:hypothetical protein